MKSEFNFRLVSSNGTVVDMDERNYWVSKFRIQPPSFSRSLSKIDGRHGKVEMDVTIDTRIIDVEVQIEGYDTIDFDLLRDEIYILFNPLTEYFIVRDLQPTKYYKVKVAQLSGIEYEDGSLEDGYFSIQFEMLQPFAESITPITKKFTSPSFNFYNEGNVPIDPREHEITIMYKGASKNLSITNNTTGEVISYTGTTLATDVLKWNGVRVTKNDVSVFKDTNKRVLTLAPGNNNITINGATGAFELTISTPFYFM